MVSSHDLANICFLEGLGRELVLVYRASKPLCMKDLEIPGMAELLPSKVDGLILGRRM